MVIPSSDTNQPPSANPTVHVGLTRAHMHLSSDSFNDCDDFSDSFVDLKGADGKVRMESAAGAYRQRSIQSRASSISIAEPSASSQRVTSRSVANPSSTTISSNYSSQPKGKKGKPTLYSFFKPQPKPNPVPPPVSLDVETKSKYFSTLATYPKSTKSTKSTASVSSSIYAASNTSIKRKPVWEDIASNSLIRKKQAVPSYEDTPTPGTSAFAKSFYGSGDGSSTRPVPRSRFGNSAQHAEHVKMPASMASGLSSKSITSKDAQGDSTNRIVLSAEQKHVVRLILNGESLFFTGAAGTGKSVLTRQIIAELNRANRRVAVTASTGLAALNIGGQTLHRFAGVGLGLQSKSKLLNLLSRKPAAKGWKEINTLIIDEVSMVDGELFDKLDYIAKALRKSEEPFGGIQVVCTGDFFQLPPVDSKKSKKFVFETESWKSAMKHTIVLTQVFRQRGDNDLINILNAMRLGALTNDMKSKLIALSRPVRYDDGIEPTELYATRFEVERSNKSRLSALKGPRHIYSKTDTCKTQYAEEKTRIQKRLDDAVLTPHELELRIDCQVMLIRNKGERLVNGSLGKVIAFMTESEFYYACQGLTEEDDIEKRLREVGRSCEEALRTAKSQQPNASLSARPGSSSEFRHECTSRSENLVVPIVKFSTGSTSHEFDAVVPFEFQVKGGPKGDQVEGTRYQIPLILSWSISIHKAQGQTLDRVKVDLRSIFETGHAYVAISRATAMSRLQILNFKASNVKVEPKVVEFYNSLTSNNPTPIEETRRQSEHRYINIKPDVDDLFG